MAAEIEPTLIGKMAIGFGDGVVVDAEIDGELAHGGEAIAGAEISGDEERAEPGENLLIRGNGRIVVNAECRCG